MKQTLMKKALSITAVLLLSQPALADENPTDKKDKKGKWTFGVGVFGASLPHYAGADQSKGVVLPFPYIHYKSEKLTIDRTGIVRKLWSANALSLTLSGNGGIKVDSKDNNARTAMPDLGWVGSVGPALNWDLRSDKSLFVQLAMRKAFAFDSGIENIGWQAETSLNWSSKRKPLGGQSTWQVVLKGRLKFATDKFNDYYYGVDTQYATATRQAYTASSGYAGAELLAGLNFAGEGYRAGLFARYNNINGVTFENSPLVRKQNNGSLGFAYAWLF